MEVAVVNRFPERSLDTRRYAGFVRWLRRRMGRKSSGCTILFCGDQEMERLHQRFLGRRSPTDVLSFPAGKDPEVSGYLGDIAISIETAARQAAREGVPFREEVRRLIVHGFLHLLGFDHETDQGEMRREEKVLIQEMPPWDSERRRALARGK